jgi:hypothetical protein
MARRLTLSRPLGAVLLLAALTVLFWKVRILDLGHVTQLGLGSLDIYIAHYPMTAYGFDALRRGDLPLWNPYQLCGEPFLAIPYTGLFYPLNFPYWLLDAATGTEVAFLVHMFFGGIAMWALLRTLGAGGLAGVTAAITFAWSGWLILNANQPSLFAAMTWMPATLLLIEWALRGRRVALLGLVVAVTCEILVGAMEVFVHTMYLAALFAVCRLVPLAVREGWTIAARRGAALAACVGAGIALGAFQLLPSAELTRLSARAPGKLSLVQTLVMGQIFPRQFLRAAVGTTGGVTVGVLPLIGIAAVLGYRRDRAAWIFALLAMVASALLVFGGPVFRFYYHVVPAGGWFRRPMKFLDIYVFAQALIAGLAVARLEGWQASERRRLWTDWTWLAALLLGLVALGWGASVGKANAYLVATVALLAAFGLVRETRIRAAILAAVCVVHGASCFFGVGNRDVRPVRRPEVFASGGDVLGFVKQRLGDARVYLSMSLIGDPGLTMKQGLLNRMPVVIDHEPLVVGRYEGFFASAAPLKSDPFQPFGGLYHLGPQTRWPLMDLTSTRYFVTTRGEPVDVAMEEAAAKGQGFRLLRDGPVRVFERPSALPRAYFVPRARIAASPEAALALLDAAGFDPRAEVVLEGPDTPAGLAGPEGTPASRVTIRTNEPERVDVAVNAGAPGFVVLTDLFYPGWRASVGGREVPVYHANYLFRAVRVEAGEHEVRFEYAPTSFRAGILVSLVSALLVAAVGWTCWRRQIAL